MKTDSEPSFADVAEEAIGLFMMLVASTPSLTGITDIINKNAEAANRCLEQTKQQVQAEMAGFKIVAEGSP